MAKPYIADLHLHISLKPVNNEKIETIWDEDNNPKPKKFYPFFNAFRKIILQNSVRNLATYTQSNLSKCVASDMRLVFCTLYPIERQYMDRNNIFTRFLASLFVFSSTFPFIRLLSRRKYFVTSLIQILLGASKQRSLHFWNEQENRSKKTINYYDDYKKELEYLTDPARIKAPESLSEYSFRLIRNYDELRESIENDKIINGIVNLEGLHSLGKYRFKDLFHNWKTDDEHFTTLINSVKNNLSEIKADGRYTLFYITLSHHFNNLLSGQAISFRGMMSKVLVQNEGVNEGIKPETWDIIKNHILSRTNGHRILVDVKHLSIKARMEYYNYISEQRQLGDAVPIISSHSAVNGIKFFNDALGSNKDGNKNKNSYVSQWNVNLTDEDIINIHRSDGIIGILMHDGRMPGGRFLKELKKVKHQHDRKNLLHQQMFMTNIYHIVRVIQDAGETNAWDRMCLGSDMDGIVDPFDNYATADRLLAFRNNLYTYINEYNSKTRADYPIVDLYDQSRYLSNAEIENLNQGLTSKEIIDRIFFKNIDRFLSIYFTEDYLEREVIV